MSKIPIAVIGGTGLYNMDGFIDIEEFFPDTPFGKPSDVITIGRLDGVGVAFLPRHGRGHKYAPSEIPYRANIFALKLLGVERIISVSAVGSLRDYIQPLDIVIPDQIIDRTRVRLSTFFEDGVVAHVGFSDPFCPYMRDGLIQAAERTGASAHIRGTYVVIEGPQFSTKAESHMYRSWGADVIGMTALPEAKLAREAEICYSTLACSTDYDCWHESEAPVTVEMVVSNLHKNAAVSKSIVRDLIPRISEERNCACVMALEKAIITAREMIPSETQSRLALLVNKYLT